MAKINYPVSIQSFRKIREDNYVYVDKTMYIHELANPGGFFFLSRPRRFGKSLLISTMENYFRGKRDLFRGLAIDRLEPEEWTKYPVLHLDFTRRGYNTSEDLPKVLGDHLDIWEREYGGPNLNKSPNSRFDSIIRTAYENTGNQVVVLVDEYDKPIIDASENTDLETIYRKMLHDFYRVMKANSDYIKFVFLTGMGKLGHINEFADFNNAVDISLNPRYSAICGFTSDEINECFQESIEKIGRFQRCSTEDTLKELADHYGGYHFCRDMVEVYNPYSLIMAFELNQIGDYWMRSSTPSHIIKQYYGTDWGSPDLEGTVASESVLRSSKVFGNDLPLTCYYFGYLTLKSYDKRHDTFTLSFPNKETTNVLFSDILKARMKGNII